MSKQILDRNPECIANLDFTKELNRIKIALASVNENDSPAEMLTKFNLTVQDILGDKKIMDDFTFEEQQELKALLLPPALPKPRISQIDSSQRPPKHNPSLHHV